MSYVYQEKTNRIAVCTEYIYNALSSNRICKIISGDAYELLAQSQFSGRQIIDKALTKTLSKVQNKRSHNGDFSDS